MDDKEAIIQESMREFNISRREAEISYDRRKVYGDPYVNHLGIAMAIAGLLQPWAKRIAAMKPLPPYVIALIMCAVKASRQRMAFHQDNYDDMNVYQGFARAWQKRYSDQELATDSLGPEALPLESKQANNQVTITEDPLDYLSVRFLVGRIPCCLYWCMDPFVPTRLTVGEQEYKLVPST